MPMGGGGTGLKKTDTWRPVVGFEGYYDVSETGFMRSVTRRITSSDGRVWVQVGKEFKQQTNRNGYKFVKMCRAGKYTTREVHVLVAAAFIGGRPIGQDIRHENGNPSDNRAVNLEYGTRKQNMSDARRHGTMARGETCGHNKLTDCQVRYARDHYQFGVTSYQDLADRFGVHLETVRLAVKRRTWAHVN